MRSAINRSLNLSQLLRIDGSRLHSGADKCGGTGSASQRENLFPVGNEKASWTVVIRELKFHLNLNARNPISISTNLETSLRTIFTATLTAKLAISVMTKDSQSAANSLSGAFNDINNDVG